MNELDRLYAGELQAVRVHPDGEMTSDVDVSDAIVLAGSFNPLHDGHRGLLDAASRMSERSGMFELSIANVDKPDLPRKELERRLDQFRGITEVAVTRAALFSDKANLLQGPWFVLGYDTGTRLVDDRYYSSPKGTLGAAARHLSELRSAGVRFLVAGRVSPDGGFRGLTSLDVPADLKDMFTEIPEAEFRADVSSTDLRQSHPE
jgi:hypothetical protein